jgi:hypothetical protein
MPTHPLFRPIPPSPNAVDVREQLQMALAIADAPMLASLLTDCLPPIAQPHQLRAISSRVSVPTGQDAAADAVLQVEMVRCVLAETHPHVQPPDWRWESRELTQLTQHESELQTLAQYIPMAPAIALLAEAGFQPGQIDEILRLPREAWYKSWWCTIAPEGKPSPPFLRCLRSRHHPDGTLTLQYKDFYESSKPACFSSQPQTVLVAIRAEAQPFGDTLHRINHQRQLLNAQSVVLIGTTLSELEVQAFMRQGVSVYPAVEIAVPFQASCGQCDRGECPMNGRNPSPVALCYGYLAPSEWV